MTKQNIFFITDFQIDLSRSVVIQGEHETQVEPKVLQVLYLLAKHQNEVVTHKEIMDHVWQGTEVVPNALQRCIAILRKVLNDNAKSPTIIATHPRIGYRLLAEVSWRSLSEQPKGIEPSAVENNQIVKTSKKYATKPIITLTILIFITAIAAFWPTFQSKHYTQINQLTQTDSHESHALFSPNAEYVVFNRYAGACKSHLWAKHLLNGKESQLTSTPGYYGAMSFTTDGREVVFAAKKYCDLSHDKLIERAKEQLCWNIATLDFSQALSAPKSPVFRHQCQAERIENPKALPNHQYAFLQYDNERYQLMKYDDLGKKLTSFYASEDLYIYHFDYDPLHKRFAIMTRDKHFNNVLVILDEAGQIISSERIRLLQGMNKNLYFSANFEPQGKYLLAISNNRLYKINFNGQIQAIKTPENNLISVVKHPKNNNLLAVTGQKDIDIAKITLGDQKLTRPSLALNSQKLPFTSFSRSAGQERNAQYQPFGDHIAFVSDRSGRDQIWLWHKEQASQLSFVSTQTNIHNFSWSPDGKQLASVTDDKLAITDLNGKIKTFDTEKPLFSVLAWYAENQLLVTLNDPAPKGLYHLDLKKNKLSPFGVNQVGAAWVHQNQLLYAKDNGEVYTRSLDIKNTESKQLPELNGNALFIHQEFIYSVDQSSHVLNKYTLQGEFIKPVMPLKATAWKVSGLRGNQLLLSQFIAINHDIVLLK